MQLLETLGQKLNDQLIIDSTLAGGCINQVYKVKGKQSSKAYVLKLNDDLKQEDSTKFFLAEKQGLETLSSHCSQYNIKIRIPKVLSQGENYILLEFIESGPVNDIYEGAFARELYKMHSQKFLSEQVFQDNYLGRTQQINPSIGKSNWSDYFWENRILYILSNIGDSSLKHEFLEAGDSLKPFIEKFEPHIGLIHGDMWSGNVFFDQDGVAVLIDPAVSMGDGRADIAMSKLFSRRTGAFYEECNTQTIWKKFPLEELHLLDEVYNLYHILNHALLFGGSYAEQAKTSLNHVLRKI